MALGFDKHQHALALKVLTPFVKATSHSKKLIQETRAELEGAEYLDQKETSTEQAVLAVLFFFHFFSLCSQIAGSYRITKPLGQREGTVQRSVVGSSGVGLDMFYWSICISKEVEEAPGGAVSR